MPIDQPEGFPVTWSQVAAWRLVQHHLLDGAPRSELTAIPGDTVGIQAQLLSAAQISLWARVQDLTIEEIDKALSDRLLVKAACMRQTQFLVPSDELAVFTRGSARRAEKDIRWARGKGVPDRDIEAAIETTLEVLEQPRTRPEIAEQVCRLLGVRVQTIQGGVGWGSRRQVSAVPIGEINFPVVYLLHLVAARGVVCSGPNLGIEPTFVRADAWIPKWQDMPGEQAEAALLRRYLHAFAPATAEDFALWSGMTLTEARSLWRRAQPERAEVQVEGWRAEVLHEDLNALVQAGLEQPVIRLLPYFDTFLLGHKNREHLAASEFLPKIYRAQGWIAPVVLVDGRAAATWEYQRNGRSLQVKVSELEGLSPDVKRRIEEEADRLRRFLGAKTYEVQVGYANQGGS